MKRKNRVLSFIVLVAVLAAALVAFTGCSGTETVITVFYTTDVHGRVVGASDVVGIDTVAALKKQTENAILIDSGDFLQGLPIANVSEGEDMVALMKAAGYSIAAVGNHEFDFGLDVLKTRIAEAEAGDNPMQVLSANVYDATLDDTVLYDYKAKSAFKPYTVQEIAGIKIGFFALTTPSTKTTGLPAAVKDLTFADPVAEAEDAVAALQTAGVDLIACISHLGSNDGGESAEIAALDGVDMVFDGHSHVSFDKTKDAGAVYVAAGEHGSKVGKLEIAKKGKKVTYKNTFLTPSDLTDVTADAAVKTMLDEIAADTAYLSEVVATSDALIPFIWPDMRTKEAVLGNFAADALLAATSADFAIFNGGNLRASIPSGDVTRQVLMTAIPYSNAVVTKSVTKAELITILEHAYDNIANNNGKFAQIGGFKVAVTYGANTATVTSITLADGTPLSDTDTYTLAINAYLADGGDGYPVLKDKATVSTFAKEDREMFTDYFALADYTKYAATDGRITLTPAA